ncbi:MAG: DUF998 domain-containing protein [Thaumarchaeota archaeon]|nr:DUF998 domain-containing protein [Nitrososphaerota archaeon]
MTVPSRPHVAHASPGGAKRLLVVVNAGVVLYLLLDIIAQILPPHYNPISTAESDLAVGPYGYIMTLNFVNRGLLSLAFLYGLVRSLRLRGIGTGKYSSGVYLLGVWAVGALLLAVFPTDVPAAPVSWHGAVHLVVALLAFLGGALGVLRLSLRFGDDPALRAARRVALPLAGIAILFLVLLFGLPFVIPQLAARIGGLTERVLIGSVLVWILMVSVYLERGGDQCRSSLLRSNPSSVPSAQYPASERAFTIASPILL